MADSKYKIDVLNDAFRVITQRLGIRDAVLMSRDDIHRAIYAKDPQADALFREYADVYIEYASNPVPENLEKKNSIGLKIVRHLDNLAY